MFTVILKLCFLVYGQKRLQVLSFLNYVIYPKGSSPKTNLSWKNETRINVFSKKSAVFVTPPPPPSQFHSIIFDRKCDAKTSTLLKNYSFYYEKPLLRDDVIPLACAFFQNRKLKVFEEIILDEVHFQKWNIYI